MKEKRVQCRGGESLLSPSTGSVRAGSEAPLGPDSLPNPVRLSPSMSNEKPPSVGWFSFGGGGESRALGCGLAQIAALKHHWCFIHYRDQFDSISPPPPKKRHPHGMAFLEKVLRFDRKRLKGVHRLFGGCIPFLGGCKRQRGCKVNG